MHNFGKKRKLPYLFGNPTICIMRMGAKTNNEMTHLQKWRHDLFFLTVVEVEAI